ncbi:hypothetical protein FD755_016036 [Muntiacus reevesi]|uniref:Small ribosomal subunit protein uS5 n=1 Tax=Muntiacus reevesi TaxID=9886 RepID=A0A5N3XG70_MUNRE|nr:hypothetical protein FD755_016036 [Muntiacus reevesi]
MGGRGAHGGKAKDKVWLPVTKLGCLVKDMKIKSLEEIHLFSLPIKEFDIIDFFLGASLKDETRFKAFVAIRDYNGCVGSDVKCSKAVDTGICGAIILAKLSIIPTVHCKVTGCWGPVLVGLIPAPRGTGTTSAPVPKKLLMMAGTDDCYISASGCTITLLSHPDLWKETVSTKSPVSMQRLQAPAVATT